MTRLVLLVAAFLQCLLMAVAAADSKTTALASLAKTNNGIIKMNSETYTKYTTGKRNYGIAVVLTAMSDQFRCVPCRDFDPEFRLVASSFQKTNDTTKLFFGHLDIQHGQEIFQQLLLRTAPNLYYFPPSPEGEEVPRIQYDLVRKGLTAEGLAGFLHGETGLVVPVTRPFDYVKLGTTVFILLGVVAIIIRTYSYVGVIIHNRKLWTAISLIIVIVFNSGQMWNRIRNPPYSMPDANGRTNFIAQGFSQQFVLESQFVGFIYAALSSAVIALTYVPQLDNKLGQRMGAYFCMTAIIVIFSCLMALFRIKNGGYPFKLLF